MYTAYMNDFRLVRSVLFRGEIEADYAIVGQLGALVKAINDRLGFQN